MGFFRTTAEIHAVIDQLAARNLAPLSCGLAAYFAVLTLNHTQYAPAQAAGPMTLLAGVTTFLMLGVYTATRTSLLTGHAHAATVFLAFVVLANFFAHLGLTREVKQSTNISLALLGGGLLFFSMRLLGLYFAAALAGWLLMTYRWGDPDWPHYGLMLMASVFLAGAAFWIRLRAITDLEGLRAANREAQLRAEAQRQLRETENRLRYTEKLESLGLLAGGVAHDLNNVLVSLIGNADLAKRMLPEDEPASRRLDLVLEASRRAADLARQMLDYSGQGRFATELVHLPRLVRNLKPMLRSAMPSHVELSTVITDNAPLIEGDPSQLEQVALELAANAGEAAVGDAPSVIVRVDTIELGGEAMAGFSIGADLRQGRYVRLSVHDNGSGIESQALERVFDPFFTTKGPGRGLGLATVSGIVRAHGGVIRIESDPGQGAHVAVLFPVASRQDPGPRPQPAIDGLNLGGGIVLVADDEPAVRMLVREVLTQADFEVIEARDGLEALGRMRAMSSEIRLVILDASMPHLTGPQVLQQIKDIALDVILTSGYGCEIANSVADQTVGFLRKPFTPAELIEAVAAALRKRDGS